MTVEPAEYFARQTAIPEIGPRGLNKLRSSSIGIAGVGGVGSAAAYFLAKSGLGRLRLVDQDVVEPSNLQRLHGSIPRDLFQPKAEAVSRAIASLQTHTAMETVVETITNANVDHIFAGVDLVIDGLDNFRTRYILNRHALRSHTPYLFASAVSEQAHLALLKPPKTPCLECVMPKVTDRFEDSCENLGVSHTITGLLGALGAAVAIHALLGSSSRLTEHMLTVDMTGPEFLFSEWSKRKNCDACTTLGEIQEGVSPTITSLCGERTANVLPRANLELNLSTIPPLLPSSKIFLQTDSVVVFQHRQFRVSLFPNGRLLILGVNEEAQAATVAEEIWHSIHGK